MAPIADTFMHEETQDLKPARRSPIPLQPLSQLSFDTPDEHLTSVFGSFEDQRVVSGRIQHRQLLFLRSMAQSVEERSILQVKEKECDSYEPQDFLLCEGSKPRKIGGKTYYSLQSPKFPGRVLGLRVILHISYFICGLLWFYIFHSMLGLKYKARCVKNNLDLYQHLQMFYSLWCQHNFLSTVTPAAATDLFVSHLSQNCKTLWCNECILFCYFLCRHAKGRRTLHWLVTKKTCTRMCKMPSLIFNQALIRKAKPTQRKIFPPLESQTAGLLIHQTEAATRKRLVVPAWRLSQLTLSFREDTVWAWNVICRTPPWRTLFRTAAWCSPATVRITTDRCVFCYCRS